MREFIPGIYLWQLNHCGWCKGLMIKVVQTKSRLPFKKSTFLIRFIENKSKLLNNSWKRNFNNLYNYNKKEFNILLLHNWLTLVYVSLIHFTKVIKYIHRKKDNCNLQVTKMHHTSFRIYYQKRNIFIYYRGFSRNDSGM